MTLQLEDVRQVARLARLALTEEELIRLQGELTAVLNYVARLDALELDAVPPTTRAVPVENVWRDDVVTPSLSTEEALSNAPRRQDGHFLIPPLFDA